MANESNKKTIGISSLITLGIVLAGMVGPQFFDKPMYFCDSRPEIGLVSCDSFSKYVADNGKCVRDDNTNLICRAGWNEVIDDRILPEEEITTSNKNEIWGKSFLCKSGQDCVAMN